MEQKSISHLFIYPIKSCAGVSADHARLTLTGFEYDREFTLVDDRGVFVSQRKYPRMALIRPRIEENCLIVEAPGASPLTVDLTDFSGERIQVKVWDDTFQAIKQSPLVNKWFQTLLGNPDLSLVRFDPLVHRYIDQELLGEGVAESKFSDQYPLTLVSEASIEDLNSRLNEKIDATHFRPNVVVSGFAPYEEDVATSVKVGSSDIILKIVKPVKRCKIVNVNPEKGMSESNEVLDTLALYRTRQTGKPGILFCVKVMIEEGIGEIVNVGDTIRATE